MRFFKNLHSGEYREFPDGWYDAVTGVDSNGQPRKNPNWEEVSEEQYQEAISKEEEVKVVREDKPKAEEKKPKVEGGQVAPKKEEEKDGQVAPK